MKIVDVLGARTFQDGERMIKQVSVSSHSSKITHTHTEGIILHLPSTKMKNECPGTLMTSVSS